MNATLIRLEDVRLEDAGTVGGKAASLGELIADGARVPPGLVLTASDAATTTRDERASLLRDAVPAMAGALTGAQPTTDAIVRDALAEEGAPENAE